MASRSASVVRLVLTTSFATYWVSMYVATHIPKVPASIAIQSDKVLHFSAYFVLGVLFIAWKQSRETTQWGTLIRLFALIAAYGAFDEITQPFFGRDAEVLDWVADICGASTGIVLCWPLARRFLP